MNDLGPDVGDALAAETEPRQRRVALPPPAGPGEIAFLDYGPADRAPDVVFLHANGFNARAYRTILSPLAGRLRILAPDQRGHGATTLAIDRPRASWLDLKDDLLAFLDAMEIEPRGAGRPLDGRHGLAAGRGRGAGAGAGAGVARSGDPAADPGAVLARAGRRLGHGAGRAEAAARLPEPGGGGGELSRPRRLPHLDRGAAGGLRRGRLPRPAGRDRHAGLHAGVGSLQLRQPGPRQLGRVRRLALPDPHPASRARVARPARRGRWSGSRRPAASASTPSPDTTHFLPMERPELVRAAILEAVAAP